PEYNEKIISFQGLAPASFFSNNEVGMFRSLARYESILESTAFALGMGEIFGNPEFVAMFRDRFCIGSIFDELCDSALSGMVDREYYNATMVPL
ncbi:hypothetical protein, partial [Citrobacter braakii]|uniref:hypothetical protein n=1 Tax=Citrobacter braakii TaxID=57706 RepID=UPI00197CB583